MNFVGTSSVSIKSVVCMLVYSGHCHDANTGQPPRGLQFTLGTNTSDIVMDTIVMANLVRTVMR